MIFVDTPGIHRARDEFNKLLVETALTALREVDAVCFVVDVMEPGREIHAFILESLKQVNVPVFLVFNKIDLLADKRMLLPLMERFGSLFDFRAVVPLSALDGDGTDLLMSEIKGILSEGPRYFPED